MARGVTYSSWQLVCMPCAQHREHYISGKRVDAKAAVPKDQGGGKLTKKMFVGGVSEVPDQAFAQYFSAFGNVMVRKQSWWRRASMRLAGGACVQHPPNLGGVLAPCRMLLCCASRMAAPEALGLSLTMTKWRWRSAW